MLLAANTATLNRTSSRPNQKLTRVTSVASAAMGRTPPRELERSSALHRAQHAHTVVRIIYYPEAEAVCCSGKRKNPHTDPSNSATIAAEGVFVDALCAATSLSRSPRRNSITLDHHLYHHLSDCWVQQSSQPKLFVTLIAMAHPDDYTTLGFKAGTSRPVTTTLCHG